MLSRREPSDNIPRTKKRDLCTEKGLPSLSSRRVANLPRAAKTPSGPWEPIYIIFRDVQAATIPGPLKSNNNLFSPLPPPFLRRSVMEDVDGGVEK